MVKNKKIICENKMNNRESKSVILNNIAVKEQRRYSSRQVLYYTTCLRFILKGFKRTSNVNNHSKLMNNKLFSTSAAIDVNPNETMSKMDP